MQHMMCKCSTYQSFHSIQSMQIVRQTEDYASDCLFRCHRIIELAVCLWLQNSVICIFHCQQIVSIACVSSTNTFPSLILHTNIEFTCRHARSDSEKKTHSEQARIHFQPPNLLMSTLSPKIVKSPMCHFVFLLFTVFHQIFILLVCLPFWKTHRTFFVSADVTVPVRLNRKPQRKSIRMRKIVLF